MSTENRVLEWLAQDAQQAYLVGGCVRDRLLQRDLYDLDVTVEGGGLDLARRLADRFRGAFYALDETRDTGRAILQEGDGERLVVDISVMRGPDLVADLADRDFTINALAVPVTRPDELIDLHGGVSDLKAGLLRPVSTDSDLRKRWRR